MMIQMHLNINVIIVKCLNRMQLKCIFWDCYAPDTVGDRKMKGGLCSTGEDHQASKAPCWKKAERYLNMRTEIHSVLLPKQVIGDFNQASGSWMGSWTQRHDILLLYSLIQAGLAHSSPPMLAHPPNLQI